MHIVQVNSAAGWGGGEVHTLQLAEGLRARGHRVTLACRPGSTLATRARQIGLALLPLPLVNALDMASAWRLAAFCRAQQADVLHVHQARDYPVGACAGLLAPRTALVLTRHLLFPLKSSPLHRWVARRASAFIAVSTAVREALVDSGIPPEIIHIVCHGIDPAPFADAPAGCLRAELHLDDDVPLIGVIGRIAPEKGQDVFIHAIPLVLAEYPQARFLISGADADGGRSTTALRELTAIHQVSDQLTIMGLRGNVPAVMRDLTLLVVPSRSEAFGLVAVEALAAGTPVVACRAGGVTEIVIDGETGLLAPPDDPPALATAINRMLADSSLARACGKAGQQRVTEQFTFDVMIERTLDVYAHVANTVARASRP